MEQEDPAPPKDIEEEHESEQPVQSESDSDVELPPADHYQPP